MQETQVLETVERELTAADRCDKCTAAARVVFTLLNGELMFCGHHARDVNKSLSKTAITVWDPHSELF
jgi:phage FluMu protein gp41